MEISKCEIYYLMFLYSMYYCNCYAKEYRKRSLCAMHWLNALFALTPVVLLAILSLNPDLSNGLIVVAGIAALLEAVSRFFPYQKRSEELLELIIKTNRTIECIERSWQKYCGKVISIDQLNTFLDEKLYNFKEFFSRYNDTKIWISARWIKSYKRGIKFIRL